MTRIIMVAGTNQLSMLRSAAADVPEAECIGVNNLYRTHEEILEELERHPGAEFTIINSSMPAETASIAKDLEDYIASNRTIVVSRDMSTEPLSSADRGTVETVHGFVSYSGIENYRRMLRHLACGGDGEPEKVPMQGLVDPEYPETFHASWEDYDKRFADDGRPVAAIITGRESWLAGRRGIETAIAEALEKEGVRPVVLFTRPKHDAPTGALNSSGSMYALITDSGRSHVDLVISPGSSSFEDPRDGNGEVLMPLAELQRRMNVPMMNPMVLSNMDEDTWRATDGLGQKLSSYIVLPECSGLTDPFMIGTSYSMLGDFEEKPIPERVRRFARRARKRIDLGRKSNAEKKIVFMLNISACASVEATIGLAVSLDTFGSLARILKEMKRRGYDVEVPESAQDIVDDILSHKSYAAHRWASPEDIEKAGGAVYAMGSEEYRRLFSELPADVREAVTRTWGEAPGGGMISNGRILVTGRRYGNAIIAVQPKRGCDQPSCDGHACKMLYNRSCPPSHAYLAAYLYFTRVWDADAVVQVGTHGTMEHLPGKSVALSGSCYPDICIGDAPLLYIFRATDSTNGSIAKRRGYATLIDHMLPPNGRFEPYGAYKDIGDLLSRLDSSDEKERDRIEGCVREAVVSLDPGFADDDPIGRARELLRNAESTPVDATLHVFGDVPTGRDLASMVADMIDGESEKPIDRGSMTAFAEAVLSGGTADAEVPEGCDPEEAAERIRGIASAISSSDELGSLMNALEGGFTPAGPVGSQDRGDASVFPTGRNFYCTDPYSLPSEKAWETGVRLAEAAVQRYMDDNGAVPESIAVAWIVSDLSLFSGEIMAQILRLIGVEPVRGRNGKVTGFGTIPLEELGRPRIDVLVRVSGSVKLYYRNCIDLVDDAINAVAALDEPDEMNFVRRHTLESMSRGIPEDEAAARVFGAAPGGNSGMFYAIASGAWKDRSDLAGIYMNSNGYAYGRGKDGVPMHGQLGYNLSKVSMTFNRIASDEKDLLSSGSYFISQGGMALGCEAVTGRRPPSYFGDTRRRGSAEVRTLKDEIGRIADAKFLNPEWREGVRKGGYKAAGTMADGLLGLYGWQAGTGEVEKRVFDGIARDYVLDQGMREELKRSNIYALDLVVRRLLEAAGRGLWEADDETVEGLKDAYLELEGDMEGLSDGGDIQGNEIPMGKEPRDAGWEASKDAYLERIRRRISGGRRRHISSLLRP